jgi:hypothetical protein
MKRQRLDNEGMDLMKTQTIVKVKRELHNEDEFQKFKELHSVSSLIKKNLVTDKISQKDIENDILEKKKKQLIKMLNLEDIDMK